jgi:hypothetical protein
VGKRFCDVTAQTPDGKRHTIMVEAESVYDAAMKFLGRSGAEFPGDRLPKTDRDTVFEVRPIYRVTQKAVHGLGQQESEPLRSIPEVAQVAMKNHFDSAEVNSLAHYLFRFEPVDFGRAALASISFPKLVGNFSNISGCGIVGELRRNN